MATSWTVGSGDYMRPYRKVRIEHFPEGGTQSFIVGDIVILETTSDKGNQIVVCGADPTAGTIVGVAAEAATGTEGTKLAVWLADQQAEFVARVQDTGVLDNDDVGDSYGVVRDGTNNIWRVDRSETTTTIVKVVKLLDGHGDTNGRVVVKFLAAAAASGPFAWAAS